MKKIMVVVVAMVCMLAGSAMAGELTTNEKRYCSGYVNVGAMVARSLVTTNSQDLRAEYAKGSDALAREIYLNILNKIPKDGKMNVYALEAISTQECEKAVQKRPGYVDKQVKEQEAQSEAKQAADREIANQRLKENDARVKKDQNDRAAASAKLKADYKQSEAEKRAAEKIAKDEWAAGAAARKEANAACKQLLNQKRMKRDNSPDPDCFVSNTPPWERYK